MKRASARGWLIAGTMLAAGGCAPSPRAGPVNGASVMSSGTSPHAYLASSNDGCFIVGFTPRPDPIPMNEVFGLTVAVFDGARPDEPLGDAVLAVDAAMPAHRHGMNRVPRIIAKGDGSFEVTGVLFHMPGHWELYFDVTRGGVTERAQIDIDLE